MAKYNRILAAVDFNEHSDMVIQNTLMQAERSGAVLHIVDSTRPIDDEYIMPFTDCHVIATLSAPEYGQPEFRSMFRTKYFSSSTRNSTEEETSRMRSHISKSIAMVPNKDCRGAR